MTTAEKIIITIGTIIMAFIPTYLFIFFKEALNPNGFWQRIVVYALGAWVLGGIQLVLVLIAGYLIYEYWHEKKTDKQV